MAEEETRTQHLDLIAPSTTPAVYFDARDWVDADSAGREKWVQDVAECLNDCLFAVVRRIDGASSASATAVREQARQFMAAATHAYPWSEDGQRVLLRGVDVSDLRQSGPALADVCGLAERLFFTVTEASLTSAERTRLDGEAVLASHDPILQLYESWEGCHGFHNDSRQSHLRLPVIGSYLVTMQEDARGLRLWPGYAEAPFELELEAGDLCLMRDTVETVPGDVRFPLTHGTLPARGPDASERIVAIHRAGIFPRSFLDSIASQGKRLMDLYLESVGRVDRV
jgi:hypothetical protein